MPINVQTGFTAQRCANISAAGLPDARRAAPARASPAPASRKRDGGDLMAFPTAASWQSPRPEGHVAPFTSTSRAGQRLSSTHRGDHGGGVLTTETAGPRTHRRDRGAEDPPPRPRGRGPTAETAEVPGAIRPALALTRKPLPGAAGTLPRSVLTSYPPGDRRPALTRRISSSTSPGLTGLAGLRSHRPGLLDEVVAPLSPGRRRYGRGRPVRRRQRAARPWPTRRRRPPHAPVPGPRRPR